MHREIQRVQSRNINIKSALADRELSWDRVHVIGSSGDSISWADPLSSENSEAYPSDDDTIDSESLPTLSPRSRPSSAASAAKLEPVAEEVHECHEGPKGVTVSIPQYGENDASGHESNGYESMMQATSAMADVIRPSDKLRHDDSTSQIRTGSAEDPEPKVGAEEREPKAAPGTPDPDQRSIVSFSGSKPNINVTSAATAARGSKVFAVKMQDYHVTDVMAVSVAESLAKFSQGSASKTSLDLSGNAIRDIGAQGVAKALVANHRITKLQLNRNFVAGNGGSAIAAALQNGCGLEWLDLSDNDLGNRTAIAIGAALAPTLSLLEAQVMDQEHDEIRTHKLKRLQLARNGIGPSGVRGLAAGLAANQSLDTLDLSRNNIQRAPATVTASAVGQNRALTSVDLSWNHFDDRWYVMLESKSYLC